MIDRIVFKIIHFDFDDLEAHIELIEYGESIRTSASLYKGKIKNVEFRVYDSIVKVAGSLHKFCKGNNYSLMTFKEAQSSLIKLSKVCGIPLENFIVTSIEIGVNMQMEQDPKAYLNIIRGYKGLPFIPMTPLSKTSQIRGVRCKLSEYDIKFYDKTFETILKGRIKKEDRKEIPINILRFEVAFSGKQLKTIGFKNLTGESLQHPHHGAMLKRKLKLIFKGLISLMFRWIIQKYWKMT